MGETIRVKVRWIDGFEKYYTCTDMQIGKDNYWFKLENGKEKWMPKDNIRHVTTEVA